MTRHATGLWPGRSVNLRIPVIAEMFRSLLTTEINTNSGSVRSTLMVAPATLHARKFANGSPTISVTLYISTPGRCLLRRL